MRSLTRAAEGLALLGLLLLPTGLLGGLTPRPAPTFTKLTPNMMVEDVNATVDFYRDVLGFETVMTVPDGGRLDWALVRRDGVEVMFQSRTSLAEELPLFGEKPTGGALTYYIGLVGVERLYEQIRRRVPIVHDLETTFYGTREFSIEDCNGFILTFAEGE